MNLSGFFFTRPVVEKDVSLHFGVEGSGVEDLLEFRALSLGFKVQGLGLLGLRLRLVKLQSMAAAE